MMMRSSAVALSVMFLVAGATALYTAKSPVVQLTPENFEEKVLKSDGVWLVEFYAPWCGHCKQLTPEWEKAAKALKGTVHVAAVDADAHRELGQKYNVEGFPTLKLFGKDKTAPVDFDGRTSDAIVKGAMKAASEIALGRIGLKPGDDEKKKEQQQQQQQQGGGMYEGSDVVELTDDEFESQVINGKEPWLIEFYAPWCGHCKNLVPEWKKAATAMAGSVKLGAVDATVHRKFSEKYGVQGFPTIKFFAPGSDKAEDYNGGRTSDAIIKFCEDKAAEYPTSPPEVGQIADNAALDTLCSKATLCVVFVVPHVIDTGASGRNAYLTSFVDAIAKVRARRVAAGWIVGGEHSNFEESFGIVTNYPTFIGLNAKNLRYATHKGAFSTEAIIASIKKMLDGKTAMSQLKGESLPKMSKGVELWDGKDYVAPPEEDY